LIRLVSYPYFYVINLSWVSPWLCLFKEIGSESDKPSNQQGATDTKNNNNPPGVIRNKITQEERSKGFMKQNMPLLGNVGVHTDPKNTFNSF
jgi:hypothetical protein